MICEQQEAAMSKFGSVVSSKLQNRLADIEAANTVLDLVVGDPKELNNSEYKIELSEEYQLVFSPNPVNVPLLKTGKINWSKVNRIKLVTIRKK